MTLTTQPIDKKTLAVYSNRARIGYIIKSDDGLWLWELVLLSGQFRGHPRGAAPTKEVALVDLTKMFGNWCRAAGVEEKK